MGRSDSAFEITTFALGEAEGATFDYNGGSRILSQEPLVACPYFLPLEKIENGNWPHPSRLPLGWGWSGHCTAPGHQNQPPSQEVLEAFCNLGYAGSCAWAPQSRVCDAVRFSVSAPAQLDRGRTENVGAGAAILRLIYVCERDHRPAEQGVLEFEVKQSQWIKRHSDLRIQRMAECFLDSYLKRRA